MVAATLPAYLRLDMAKRRQAYNTVPTAPGLGEFVRERREAMALSQEGFAALVGDGMSGTDVSQLERGKVGLPKPPRMIAVARALGMHVADLYVAAGYPEFRGRVAAHAEGEARPPVDGLIETVNTLTQDEIRALGRFLNLLTSQQAAANDDAADTDVPATGTDRA